MVVSSCERKGFVDCCNIWSLANKTLETFSLVFIINNDLLPFLSLLVSCSHLSLPESFQSETSFCSVYNLLIKGNFLELSVLAS